MSDLLQPDLRSKTTSTERVRDGAWVVRNLLEPSECTCLIQRAQALGMVDLGETHGNSLRECLRVELDDAELAELVFTRLRPFIPEEVVVTSGVALPGVKSSPELRGTWRPFGCNSHLRIACYPGSGHFGPHRDGDFVANHDRRSLLTVNGYLNALPRGKGGATRFLNDNTLIYKDDRGRFVAPPGSVEQSVHPDEAGMATVFFHDLLHDGEPLDEGCPSKWIFRTDVLYERVPGTGPQLDYSEQQQQARKMLAEAEQVEAEDPQRAMRLYRSAFKMDPTLEESTQRY